MKVLAKRKRQSKASGDFDPEWEKVLEQWSLGSRPHWNGDIFKIPVPHGLGWSPAA